MNSTQHRLVSTYLDDLARMLADLPPEDRAEVLAGVREHIDAALAERPGAETDVQSVLAELGPPDLVAREAYESGQYAVRSPHPSPPVRRPIADRGWVPVTVAVLQVLAVVIVLLTVGGTAAFMVEATSTSDGAEVVTTNSYGGGALVGAVTGAVMALPLWIAVALFVGSSRLWVGPQKAAHLLFLPVTVLLLAALPTLGWALGGPIGLVAASWTTIALVVLGGGWLLARLTSAARRRLDGQSLPADA
ncbi:HAAS signaling domain-containing protein [Ornithinimicrobium cavernae]|uniref:HAAS signaling domain-containing protein n=1 Tax=Ornithinimicrobium cavernae TaxID=2666047 RepID=UPI000D686BBA|nr:hypothetical protein [Ornithinimicrobium cavernae]